MSYARSIIQLNDGEKHTLVIPPGEDPVQAAASEANQAGLRGMRLVSARPWFIARAPYGKLPELHHEVEMIYEFGAA